MVLWYDDLIQSPDSELQRIINQAGLSDDVTMTFRENEELKIGHLVGGNRMARRNQQIQIDPSQSSEDRLSKLEQFVVRRLGAPIERLARAD